MSIVNVIDTQLAVQLVTAAWDLYRKNGWADRYDREVVNEPLVISTEPDVRIQPLLFTLRENAFHLIGSENVDRVEIALSITDDIRERAQADFETVLQNGVLTALLDDNQQRDNFANTVAELLKESMIKIKDFNKLCYVNKIADRVRSKQHVDELVAFAVNQHLGAVGSTVGLTVTVLSASYRQEWNTYSHVCISGDGHIVRFLYKNKMEAMTTVNILGKIKAHNTSWQWPDMAETQLNYVKVLA
jgi:hypothetical protein